jgi:DNA-binding NarL/FixJ family response regulator
LSCTIDRIVAGEGPGTQERRRDERPRIKILSVDDHPLIAKGIAIVIGNQPDMDLVAHVSTGIEAIERYRRDRPDVILMDLRLPDVSGIDATIAIRTEFPQARVIILSTFGGETEVRRALEAGASGYILKSLSADELITAIRAVHAGNKRVQTELAAQIAEHMGEERLTTRETEVLDHVAAGRRNREIAKLLYVSEETVKAHLRHIVAKLGAKSRTHALAIANRRGLVRF